MISFTYCIVRAPLTMGFAARCEAGASGFAAANCAASGAAASEAPPFFEQAHRLQAVTKITPNLDFNATTPPLSRDYAGWDAPATPPQCSARRAKSWARQKCTYSEYPWSA